MMPANSGLIMPFVSLSSLKLCLLIKEWRHAPLTGEVGSDHNVLDELMLILAEAH